MNDSQRPWRNFYGRRRGKALRPGQRMHLETTLATLTLPRVNWEDNPDRVPLALDKIFPDCTDLWLEIGFGGGEHLLHVSQSNDTTGIIGCEPFINGVAMVLPHLAQRGATRVRLHPGDARDLLDVVPDAAFGRVYLLYPDPWPKKKHHRRRFVNAENLAALARVMRPGSELRIATDIPDYVRHCLEEVMQSTAFDWHAEGPADWRAPWADWPGTRYERKALREGRAPHYLRFVRR